MGQNASSSCRCPRSSGDVEFTEEVTAAGVLKGLPENGGSASSSGIRERRPPTKLKNGAEYSGEWLGHYRDGQGCQVWPDDGMYEGQWSMDKAHGKGKFSYSDGDVYEGDWVNDKAHGEGVYHHTDGSVYEGQWVEDRQHGIGVEVYPDGAKYSGQYRAGRKHGVGKFAWSDKSVYQGEFKVSGARESDFSFFPYLRRAARNSTRPGWQSRFLGTGLQPQTSHIFMSARLSGLPGCLACVLSAWPFLRLAAAATLEDGSVKLRGSQAALLSFDEFMQHYQRSYELGSSDYLARQRVYEERLRRAMRHNSQSNRLWTAGINEHSDWTDSELDSLHGWRRVEQKSLRMPRQASSMLEGASVSKHLFSLEEREIPERMLWMHLNSSAAIKNQGRCGSCWAVTAASLLEAYTEIYPPGAPRSFSAQQLVSCVPNPQECGGTGGCKGATVELGLDWAWKNGLVTAQEEPYHAKDLECKQQTSVMHLRQVSGDTDDLLLDVQKDSYLGQLAFGMSGWQKLPENEYLPVLQALYNHGPLGASVAARTWHDYDTGIFDDCDKDVVLGHAVMLMGYDKDKTLPNAPKYWLVKNSWGRTWGENGYIRLLRSDLEQEYCGMDDEPEKGTGCKGGPPSVRVCGMCGILYDNAIPEMSNGARSELFTSAKSL